MDPTQNSERGCEFEDLTPSELTNIAYALHGSIDPDLCGEENALAKMIVRSFFDIKPSEKSENHDKVYIRKIQGIVLSLSRAITRRKRSFKHELADAENQYKKSQERMEVFRKNGILMFAGWKIISVVGLMGMLAALGYWFAKSMAGFIPDDFSGATGEKAPSILIAIVFAMIGRYVSIWLDDRKRNKVLNEYNWRKSNAKHNYEEGKYEEIRKHEEMFRVAWEEYTGKTCPRTVSYLSVMESDLRILSEERKNFEAHSLGDWERFKKIYGFLRKARKKKELEARPQITGVLDQN